MKKNSINLLKVGILLLLGVCMIGSVSEVNAGSIPILRTYYAYSGSEIKVESSYNHTNEIGLYDENNYVFASKTATATKVKKDGNTLTMKLPTGLSERTNYFMWGTNSYVNQIYIMPEYMISPANANGHNKIYSQNSKVKTHTMYEGESIQLEVYTKDSSGGLSKQKIKDLGLTTNPSDEYYRTKTCSTKFEVTNGKDVVTIDQNGKLTAKKAGSAVVKFTRTIIDERVVNNTAHKAYSHLTSIINIKVVAKTPTAPKKVTLTMEFGDGVNKAGNHSEQGKYDKGTTITLNRGSGNNQVTLKGNKLVGWKVKDSNPEIKYTDGSGNNKFTIDKNITLVAIWEAVGGGLPSDSLAIGDKLKYTYSSQGWNVRSSKNTRADNEVGEIVKDNVVEVTAISGNWVSVKFNGGTGYIYYNDTAKARFEKVATSTAITGINEVDEEPEKPSSESLNVGDKLKYTYSSQGWNVRNSKKLKIEENKIGEIVKDNVVEVTAISGNWVSVKFNGGTGYIYYDNTAKARFEKVAASTAITGIDGLDGEPEATPEDEAVVG